MVMPPAAELPSVRLRLVFDSRRLLQRAQRDEGLRRCWLLLRPELATVADLATHVADRFCLGRSCPRGVVLSMDGFTLPPFESTGIFRDKDIIRVKQKSSKNMIEHHDVGCIQDPVIVEKRLLPTDDKILAIEYKTNDNKHQDKEQCGHQQQEIATTSHCIESKRKCRDGDAGVPENSRKKKPKVVNPENDVDVNNEDDAHQHNDQNASKNLMFPSTDSITTKATLRTESTCFLEEKQKTDKTDSEMSRPCVVPPDSSNRRIWDV